MMWSDLHATLLSKAFEKLLGFPAPGAMAFVRCFAPEVVEALAADERFSPGGWRCYRVADEKADATRTITADEAVELREGKNDAVLLLVDTARSGAGMDGIYSAAREVEEPVLFHEALRLAAREVTTRLGSSTREYATQAVKKARGFGRLYSISRWTEFDFYTRIAAERQHPGQLLWLIGMWPVEPEGDPEARHDLEMSRIFVDRLLGPALGAQTPTQRIESLRLLNPSEEQQIDLERFLRSAATRPLLVSLSDLAQDRGLWVNALKLERAATAIQEIELVPWQTRQGKIAKWSGLQEGADGEPPILFLDPDADAKGDYRHLEVRWKARPSSLERDAVQYLVSIITDMDEELTSRSVSHSAKKEEKCRFTSDDFSRLDDDAFICATALISVIGNDSVEKVETEEFIIRFGTPVEREAVGIGKKERTFSEGLIELESRDTVTTLASATEVSLPQDSKGYVVLRTGQRGKTYRVFRPPLIREIEEDWAARGGEVGRWNVKVRASGARAGRPEFIPLSREDAALGTLWQSLWDRAAAASRRLAERFNASGGGVGQIYDQNSKVFDSVVKEYMLAWASLLDDATQPALALANTVEVRSLSGRTIGLIVLPAHPLRVAWHVAYDNLVLHTRFDKDMTAKEIREEFKLLDGAMFPAFLPGDGGGTFVFADTLGFHAVGMVPVEDHEPKAAIAILARALGESESEDTAPTVARQSAKVLGNEILKYIECHGSTRLLHIHALRPGDGLTVVRSLGHVQRPSQRASDEDEANEQAPPPSFVLELYPSKEQRGVAGRFIAEAREKRRTGAGVLSNDDRWMLESTSLANGMTLPKLRWARRQQTGPKTAAHLAIAFDTFESRVSSRHASEAGRSRPYFAFGLMSFFERRYTSTPSPIWDSFVVNSTDGEKHPADRTHTERLVRLQQSIWNCVSRALGASQGIPVLRTEISPEKADSLRELHRLCDWVITLDRNAGIEYFDSPRDNRDIYDAYVIDCVPEREDLGCLQLITSTSNLDEIRNLLDEALGLMGLSRSRRNAEFLQEHLKALSGRLAIRLTGQKAPTAELIALAMCHANCCKADDDADCWMSLRSGFFIPVDDIRDLLPPVADDEQELAPEAEVDRATKATRPDLIFVSLAPRKGLLFRFAEVKYRRHLRTARGPDALERVRQQVERLRERWEEWYGASEVCASFRAIRRAKLARVLRFYADKARRHADDDESIGLSREAYGDLIAEIDRLIEKGGDYSFATVESADRGWIFCPEYMGAKPLDITPAGWTTRVFLFGPDFDFRLYSIAGVPLESGASSSTSLKVDATGDGTSIQQSESNENISMLPDCGGPSDSGDQVTGGAALDRIGSAHTICLGTNLVTGAEVRWDLTIKGNPHLLVAGLPGMGKTTCLLNLCRQMLSAGIRPIVFSYHQDIDEKLQQCVGSVRFIDFNGLGFNPLQVIDRKSRMAYLDVAGAVRDIFTAIFPELGDIQGERIRKALKDSFIEYGWDDPSLEAHQLREPPFSRFVEILRSDPKPDRGLKTLLSRLEELDDYGFFRPAEDQESLWASEHPTVLRIHSTQNDNLQKAFASLVFYGLYKDMFRRGTQDRITHCLIFDEAHRAARLQLIPTMAKECRKYGISLVLASQEARDFHVSLFSAIANYLVLRLNELDAKALARNIATSDQERTLIDRIKQMERFHAFYCSEGIKKPVSLALQP